MKIILIIFIILIAGCSNFFHELMPSDENNIISFIVEGQVGSTRISGNTVKVPIDYTTDKSSLFPSIEISHKATLLPLTFEYLEEAFPSGDTLAIMEEINNTEYPSSYILNLTKQYNNFTPLSAIDKPIDFTNPVDFVVISAQGSARQYTVTVATDIGEPRLTGFGFLTSNNSELANDVTAIIDEGNKRVYATARHSAGLINPAFILIPTFTTYNSEIFIGNSEIISGTTPIQFAKIYGAKEQKTLTLTREDKNPVNYILIIEFLPMD